MTIQLEITTPVVHIVAQGVEVQLDLTKLSPDILRSLLAHGAGQKVRDAAANSTAQAVESEFGVGATTKHPDAKAWLETAGAQKKVQDIARAMMEKAMEGLYAGNWVSRQGSGLRIEADPVAKLAHEKAKARLMAAIFRPFAEAAKIKPTLEQLHGCGQAKVSAFFTLKAKKAVWDESAVGAWIKAQADAGKTDYMELARAELAAMEEAVDGAAIDDLLADL